MAYVHQQQPCPAQATGVPVKLQAISSDGATTDLGTVTSDSYGLFKKMWNPQNAGEYTIVATFQGTNSYGSSYSETAIGVESTSDAHEGTVSNEVYYVIIALIIILILAIAVLLLLRRH
jgi:hypothetical protein